MSPGLNVLQKENASINVQASPKPVIFTKTALIVDFILFFIIAFYLKNI